jgi:tetratricopeptide (TPR) repeat protein
MAVCPELETLAAYADDRLSAPERLGLLRHLAACAECRAIVTETVACVNAVAPLEQVKTASPHRPARPKFRVVIGVLGLAAALIVAVRIYAPAGSQGAVDASHEALAESLRAAATAQSSRPIEPRLTGGFAHRPFETTRSVAAWPADPQLRIAGASLGKELASDSSPRARRLKGAAALRTGDVDGAIRELAVAADGAAEEAERLTDLSAAHYVRGSLQRNAADFTRAHAFASQATERRPGLAEAWFNRALAAEAAGDGADAALAWKRYLELDPASSWADEARRHVRNSGT